MSAANANKDTASAAAPTPAPAPAAAPATATATGSASASGPTSDTPSEALSPTVSPINDAKPKPLRGLLGTKILIQELKLRVMDFTPPKTHDDGWKPLQPLAPTTPKMSVFMSFVREMYEKNRQHSLQLMTRFGGYVMRILRK